MIKITRAFNTMAENHRNKILSTFDIENKLAEKILITNNSEKDFYQYLKDNINAILENKIDYLKETIVPDIDRILGVNFFGKRDPNDKRKKVNKAKIEEVSEIFNYTSFSEFKTTGYNAYDLLQELNINVCPYCNRQYINTIKPSSTEGGTRPTLDHFLVKSDYPYLGLSFWNLVPSCYSCNSQLRGTRDIGLHPYVKGFEKILHFYTDITDDITEFIGTSEDCFELTLKKYKDIEPNTDDFEGASKNLDVFRLNYIYQNHKDYVREIIQKTIVYSEDYSNDLYNNFSDIFENELDARNMMLSNYTDIESLEKRPLAKLTKDIAMELKII